MSDAKPYDLLPEFERALVTLLCSSPDFYKTIGEELEIECLALGPAQLALKAARQIYAETGAGPNGLVILAQRLARWKRDGRVTYEEIGEVMDLFDMAEDRGLPPVEAALKEISPILKARLRDRAIRSGIEALGKEGDMAKVIRTLQKSERIGEITHATGVNIAPADLGAAFGEIERVRHLERLPTGIDELDIALDGGAERGSLFVIVGQPGDGKSMILIQAAAHAYLEGLHVAYATLELNRARTLGRLIANLSGIPTNAVLDGKMDQARQVVEQVSAGEAGSITVEYFTPGGTTVDDIREWVERMEAARGRKMDLIVVDYADKLSAPKDKQQGDYHDMREVFESFRIWMESTQRWGWTASQAKRKDKRQQQLDINDGADSQHKARVADGFITINLEPDGTKVSFFIAKNRNGTSRLTIGPLPTDFPRARIAPVNRAYESRSRTTDDGSDDLLFN